MLKTSRCFARAILSRYSMSCGMKNLPLAV
jgi:hypothetical protein